MNSPSVTWKYEEFVTICCKVESFLNSRPLTPLSSDPNCLEALTPGHFAIQRSLIGVPTGLGCTSKLPVTKKWFLLQKFTREIWERFQYEHLNLLQKRNKCQNPGLNAKIGDMVIIEEANFPSMVWKMGRIIKTYSDEEGTVRKVDLQTQGKQVVHRAVRRLVPLLPEEDEKQEPTPLETVTRDAEAGNNGENTDATAEIVDTVNVPLRRSSRVKASFAKNVALALMCLCTTAFGFEVTPLTLDFKCLRWERSNVN